MHAVIWGRRRQGKSTLALALALALKRKPVIIFDPCAQFGAYPIFDSPLDGFESQAPIFRVGLSEDPSEAFADLMAELDGGEWEWADYTLIVDEASFLQRPQSIEPALARLIRQAPGDIGVIQTLHRPSETHPTVRALASDLFFFHTYLERDLDSIEKNFGPELAKAVAKLPQHHVIHWWLAEGGTPRWEVWSCPEEWKIDIGGNMLETTPTPVPNEPEISDGPMPEPEPPNAPGAEEAPPVANPEGDPVRELLRVNKREIDRLEKQNRKLRERVRKLKETKPLTQESADDSIGTEVPVGTKVQKDLWNLITGE